MKPPEIYPILPDVIGSASRYHTDHMRLAWSMYGASLGPTRQDEIWYWGKCKPSADRAVLSLLGCLDASVA